MTTILPITHHLYETPFIPHFHLNLHHRCYHMPYYRLNEAKTRFISIEDVSLHQLLPIWSFIILASNLAS